MAVLDWSALFAREAAREIRVRFVDDSNTTIASYGQDAITGGRIESELFSGDELSAGGTVAKICRITIIDPQVGDAESIPRACPFWIEMRLVDGGDESAWYPLGRYYIDLRERSVTMPEVLSITAYDGLLKGEVDYYPYGSAITGWPKTDVAVIDEIAARLGVQVAQETYALLTKGYQIPSPDAGEGGYTVNEMLSSVGKMYGGDWYLDEYDELRLYVIGSEVSLLADENGAYVSDSTGVMLIV